MIKISKQKIKMVKNFIFQNGRLLERKLYSYFFENGSKQECIIALQAYQNSDGGFGNGIEPDLLCPDSTAIGAETAMYIFDIIDVREHILIDNLKKWIINKQNEKGTIPHPPKEMFNYPFQPWWKNPDNFRILTLIGYLNKWNIDTNVLNNKIINFFIENKFPDKLTIFDYPYMLYAKYCSQNEFYKEKFFGSIEKIPNFLEENKIHYPLFSRYWYHFIDDLEKNIILREANNFIAAIQEDGGISTAYPDLPWWRPIFTLDGLIILKKKNLLNQQ